VVRRPRIVDAEQETPHLDHAVTRLALGHGLRDHVGMALFDHLGVSVDDLPRSVAQFDPVLTALGLHRFDSDGSVAWSRPGEIEFILFPARETGTGPHRHGHVGWQHLAFAVDDASEVDRLHAIAVGAGWTAVREPKPYPRFSSGYYASFVEDDNGIRIEFMYNPPKRDA
jgi:catechol 2,3-dioxygenase-like lactoylglutathione lyase family enzyme